MKKGVWEVRVSNLGWDFWDVTLAYTSHPFITPFCSVECYV
jgi:hypothetical protein